MKHSNLYLYGVQEVPYIQKEVIIKRLELLQSNLKQINDVDYKHRDFVRRDAIIKAIKFWQQMQSK